MSNPKKGYLDVLSGEGAGEDMFREVPLLYGAVIHLKARKILDLGVLHGLSTRAFLIGCIETDGHVWSVDLKECPIARQHIAAWGLEDRWTFTVMDSLSYVKTWKEGLVDICLIDTSHTFEQTLAELEAYTPLVRSEGRIFIHDTIPAHPGIKVMDALQKFLGDHPGEYDFYNFKTKYGLGRLIKKGLEKPLIS